MNIYQSVGTHIECRLFNGEWTSVGTSTAMPITSSTMTTFSMGMTEVPAQTPITIIKNAPRIFEGHYSGVVQITAPTEQWSRLIAWANNPKPLGKIKSWRNANMLWADMFLHLELKTHNFVSATLKDNNK